MSDSGTRKLLVFWNAFQMRLPYGDAPPVAAMSTWRLLFWDNICKVTITGWCLINRVAFFGLLWRLFVVGIAFFLAFWYRRGWNQEVNATSFELGVRRKDYNSSDNALRGRFAQDVIRVSLKNLAGRDWTCHFFYKSIQMDNSDQVESSTWKNTSQTAS